MKLRLIWFMGWGAARAVNCRRNWARSPLPNKSRYADIVLNSSKNNTDVANEFSTVMAAPDKNKWKRFERLIAAIEAATSKGATVTWNEIIAGRQFDVVIRFTNGPHSYVTLVECKDVKHPVAVEKIDAFATKAHDANANKAVIVSSAGFQSGCVEVAKRHGIDLFRLNEHIGEPPGLATIKPQPVHIIYNVRIRFTDGRTPLFIPETNNRLDYLLSKGSVTEDGVTELLMRRLDRIMERIHMAEFDREEMIDIPLRSAFIEIPTLLPRTATSGLSFTVVKQMKKIAPPSPMDAHLQLKIHSQFELVDVIRDIPVTTVGVLDLPIGFDTIMEPGKFYTSMLEQNYYCENVESGNISLALVEAYMHGTLFQARMGMKPEAQKYYVEITDLKEILRLQAMYHRLIASGPRRPS